MTHLLEFNELASWLLVLDRIVEFAAVEDRDADVIITMIDQDRNVDLVRVLHRVHALHGVALEDSLDAVVTPFIRKLRQV